MSEPRSSFICLAAHNYKIASTITCIIYLVIGGICMIQLLNNNRLSENIFLICWNFSCSFVNGKIGLSFGIFICSILALIGIYQNWPFLMIPLMIMQMFLFVVMKLKFADYLMFLMHEEDTPFMFTFLTCAVCVILSVTLGFTLWILYCAFIKISFPSSPKTTSLRSPESPQPIISEASTSSKTPTTAVNIS